MDRRDAVARGSLRLAALLAGAAWVTLVLAGLPHLGFGHLLLPLATALLLAPRVTRDASRTEA